jgi:hypothetical protein
MPAADITAQMAAFGAVLANMRADEALKRQTDEIAAAETAFRGLDDALSQFTGDTLAKFDKETTDMLAKLDEEAKKFRDDSDATIEYQQARQRLVDALIAYRSALSDVAGVEQDLRSIENDLFAHRDDWNQLSSDLSQLLTEETELSDKVQNATNPAAASQYATELQHVREEIKKVEEALGLLEPKETGSAKRVEQLASAWGTVARSIVGALQALGGLSGAGAALAQNAINLSESIAKIYASGGTDKSSWVEAATSTAGLVKSIMDMGHAASEAQQHARELAASINSLFLGLTQQIGGSGSLQAQIDNAKAQYDQARNTIERDEGGKKNQAQREADLARLNELEAERIQQIKDEYAAQQASLQEDAAIRAMRAEGQTELADEVQFATQQQREMTDAIKNGADADTVLALKAAQAAEATAFFAQEMQKAAAAALQAGQTAAEQYDQIHHVTDPIQQFQDKAKEWAALGGAFAQIFAGFDLNHLSASDIEEIDRRVQEFFDEVSAGSAAVNTAGLSLDDFKTAMLDIDKAATSAASNMAQAADALSAKLNGLANYDETILGVDPATHAINVAKSKGFDVSPFVGSASGVADTIAWFQQYFQQHPEQGADIAAIIQALRAISFGSTASGVIGAGAFGNPALASITNSYQGLTAIQGDRLADIQMRELSIFSDQLAVLVQIRDYLRPTFTPPTVASLGTQSGVAGAGPIVVNLTSTVNVAGGTSAGGDVASIGNQIAESTARAINVALGRQVQVQQAYQGSIAIAPFNNTKSAKQS